MRAAFLGRHDVAGSPLSICRLPAVAQGKKQRHKARALRRLIRKRQTLAEKSSLEMSHEKYNQDVIRVGARDGTLGNNIRTSRRQL